MYRRHSIAFIALTAAVLISPQTAIAASSASDVFNTGPLESIINFITGPVARFIAILAVFALGAMITMGQGFQGFGQRVPTVLVGIIFIIGAVNVVDYFVGGSNSSGASLSLTEMYELQAVVKGSAQ